MELVPSRAVVGHKPSIHDIPEEVIHRIWAYSVYPYWSPDHLYRFRQGWISGTKIALRLSGVCMRWRSISLNLRWLWADFDICRLNQLKFLHKFLQRAHGAHLRFSFACGAVWGADIYTPPEPTSPWFHPLQKDMWEEALKHIGDNLQNTTVFHASLLHQEDIRTLIATFSGASIPVLQYLQLRVPDDCMHIPFPTSTFYTPSMQKLELYQQPDDWSSPIFANLTDLMYWQRREETSSRRRIPHGQVQISPSKIASILAVARKLVYLTILEGFIVPDDIPPGRSAFPTSLEYMHIHAEFTDPTAFDQLCDVVCVEDIRNFIFDTVPIHGVPRLLTALEGQYLDLHLDGVNLHGPKGNVWQIISTLVWYDAAEIGHWKIIIIDEVNNSRTFTVGPEWFAQGTLLKSALSPIIGMVSHLHIYAGQWPQLSAGLKQLSLDHVDVLEIVFLADLSFPRDESHPTNTFPETIEPVYIPGLSGSIVSFPDLKFLFLRGTCTIPPMEAFLPLHLTANSAKSIHSRLGSPACLSLVEFHDIILANDETDNDITRCSEKVFFFEDEVNKQVKAAWWGSAEHPYERFQMPW